MDDKLQKKWNQAQVNLDEIVKEVGGRFVVHSWHMDRSLPDIITAFVTTSADISLDLNKAVAKWLICKCLISAHEDTIHLLQCTVDKLRKIQEEC